MFKDKVYAMPEAEGWPAMTNRMPVRGRPGARQLGSQPGKLAQKID